MRAGQRTPATRMTRHLNPVPDLDSDLWIAYSLGEANGAERERRHWQQQLQRIIDAADAGTLQRLLDEGR